MNRIKVWGSIIKCNNRNILVIIGPKHQEEIDPKVAHNGKKRNIIMKTKKRILMSILIKLWALINFKILGVILRLKF